MLICFVYRFGARDAKARNKQKEYDFIMDEEIEFVQVLQMPGTRKDKVHLLEFFISPELKTQWNFPFTHCLSFILTLRQYLYPVIFSHIWLLLHNHTTDFYETWHKAYFCEGNLKLFQWRTLMLIFILIWWIRKCFVEIKRIFKNQKMQ